MKDTTYTKKFTYIGAGCGLVIFVIFGLLPGSFLGGVMGLNIAGILLGIPIETSVLSRMLVAAFMVIGVMVSGVICIMASSTAGWLIGTVIDSLRSEKKDLAPAENNNSQ